MIKIKLHSEKQSYAFTLEHIDSLTNVETSIEILYNLLNQMHRSLTAAELNSMTFVDAIKIVPELFRLPWATPFFILKRFLKKFLQLFCLVK